MKKSVYSIVLMDDVIKAVDEQAYRLGTSRSNLINQILAEHLSCITPEMRMREIFDSVAEIINSEFRIQQQRSSSLITMQTALEYKYRPTVSYKVELDRSPGAFLGELRVQIRTQNLNVMDMFHKFFVYRTEIEHDFLKEKGYGRFRTEIGAGIFKRALLNADSLDHEETGEAIGAYIRHINKALNTYFSAPQDFPENAPALEREYEEMLDKYII